MDGREITYPEALALAVETARRKLRKLFPADESKVFDSRVIEDINFWLFFRNRDIRIPDVPNGEVEDDCAFAVGRHGMVLTVKDNLDDERELDEQISGLSGYFQRRESSWASRNGASAAVVNDLSAIGVRRPVLGGRAFLPLAPDAETRLLLGITHIGEMVDVEQKFDIVLANLLELEQELAGRSLKQALHAEHSLREMLEDRLVFNRRLINLLTATRLYIDQAKHHIGVFFPGDTAVAADLDRTFSAEYDGSLAYRVMEALRNFAQHKGLPLQGFTHANRWIDINSPDAVMESNVGLNLNPGELMAMGGFKSAVLAELEALGEIVDIKTMIRQHVECLGRVHSHFRGLVTAKIDDARAVVAEVTAAFTAVAGNEPAGGPLGLVRQHADGTYDIEGYLPTTALQYLDILQGRSRNLANLSRRIVSTAQIPRRRG